MSKKNITYSLPEIIERLSAFFPETEVKSFPMSTSKSAPWKGMAAFYIDNRAVQQRLDDTCVWKNEFVEDPRSTKSILCKISILIERPNGDYEWVTRMDGADNTDIEATKGGLSGSMRRAAVQWGIGRYLYEVDGIWLPMKEPKGSPKPKYFVQEPRMPAAYLPNATRARATKSADTEAPASVVAEESTPKAKAASKLTAAQTATLQEASDGRNRTKVAKIYGQITTGSISFDDGIAEIQKLPKS